MSTYINIYKNNNKEFSEGLHDEERYFYFK